MADCLWFAFRRRTAPGARRVLGATFGSFYKTGKQKSTDRRARMVR